MKTERGKNVILNHIGKIQAEIDYLQSNIKEASNVISENQKLIVIELDKLKELESEL